MLRHCRHPGAAHGRRPPRPRLPRAHGAGGAVDRRPAATSRSSSRAARTCARCGRGATGAALVERRRSRDLDGARPSGVAVACSARVEAEVTPADPMVGHLLVGLDGRPEGRGAHARPRRPPRPQPVADARHHRPTTCCTRRCRCSGSAAFSFTLIAALHAGATLVFENQFDPPGTLDADRAGADHPGARLAAHGQGARRPSRLQDARPVVDPPAGSAGASCCRPTSRTRRAAAGQLARHDRDARPAHVRLEGQHPHRRRRTGSFGFSVPGCRAQDRRPRDRRGLQPVGEIGRAVDPRLLADAGAAQA